MGIPENIDPPPQKIEIDWPVNAVIKTVQEKRPVILSAVQENSDFSLKRESMRFQDKFLD